jgi:succinate dehydrogenase / fumarate reductase, cytochrome b subunit
MSTTAVSLRQSRAAAFWYSTTGKKIVMAVTGAILFLFVIGHMLGNLQVFEGPERINAYGHFLHSLGEILWAERIGLLAAVVLHITATVQLGLRSKAARPVGYSRREAINSSYASRTMYWSGPIVLAFVIFHLLHLTAGIIVPGAAFIEGDVYHNVVSGFQVWWVSVWYIFAICLLGLHLRHGIWSMFQSVGLNHPRYTPMLKQAAVWIAAIIVLGYISIPISVLLGLVKE